MNKREIKFRAWDGAKFIDVNKLEYVSSSETYNNVDGFNVNDNLGIPSNYLQQYTGLKDKNGKEIYEGDILIFSPWKNNSLSDYLSTGLKKIVYSLEQGGDYPFAGFAFISLSPVDLETGIKADVMNSRYGEIIGNIFENSELT